jgi:hypothetical protein
MTTTTDNDDVGDMTPDDDAPAKIGTRRSAHDTHTMILTGFSTVGQGKVSNSRKRLETSDCEDAILKMYF